MASPLTDRLSFRTLAIVGLTLTALALGGATEIWAQSIVLLSGACIIFLFPPRINLGWIPALALIGFLTLAFCAFLPESWCTAPAWRHHLSQDLLVPLGNFRTPQPWLTLQGCCLLFFGLVWTYYLCAQEWSAAEKSQALRLFVAGIIVLAAITIVAYLTGQRIPGWTQEANRGWFPNRNQTADVLAISGIANYAIAFRLLQKRQWIGLLWLVGLILIGGALIIAYSRAGILLFFAGIALWHANALFRPGQGKNFAIGLSAGLLLLSLFFLFGGSTLDRFQPAVDGVDTYAPDYRTRIQEDALFISFKSPLLGVGLGNFEPIFTSMRDASADQNRTIHPESDWLWMAVEMGWLASALILAGLYWWLSQCLPFNVRAGEALRRAAMIAFVLFLLHGFVDVAGHRLGSFSVGLLMAALALSPHRKVSTSPWVAPVFRGLALIVALIGAWWLDSCSNDSVPPTSATLARIHERLNQATADGRIASVYENANAALNIAPLDWTNYFRRACAEAFRTGGLKQADKDFKVARFLEPHWIGLCQSEGEIWLQVNEPARCLEAWNEALRRAGPDNTTTYTALLRLADQNPQVHLGLRQAAQTNLNYQLAFLEYAKPDEMKEMIDAMLARDPSLHALTPEQLSRFFTAWSVRGDQDAMAQCLEQHPEWQEALWKILAHYYAGRQDFALASLTALRYLPHPPSQAAALSEDMTNLQITFARHPEDVIEGVELCQAEIQAGQVDDALTTIAQLEKDKDCPRYIAYFQAQLYAKKQNWEQAYDALRDYGNL